jgi:hypothetical protein
VLGDEPPGRELEDEPAIHLLVELEVKRIDCLAGIAKAGLLDPPVEETILSPEEFIADEPGEEVERRQALGLRLQQARLEAGGHAGAAEVAEGALKFEQVHEGAPSVSRAMRRGSR